MLQEMQEDNLFQMRNLLKLEGESDRETTLNFATHSGKLDTIELLLTLGEQPDGDH